MKAALLALFFGLALLIGPVDGRAETETRAQSNAEEAASDVGGLNMYEFRLIDLSAAFGALHHLRPLCRPEEADLWRARMKELVKLEQPSRRQMLAMTNKFNDAFKAAQAGFYRCDEAARREARIMADNAARVSAALLADLSG